MTVELLVYGASGSGSVPIEATLMLLDVPYRVEEHSPWRSQEEASSLALINPMVQVPAVRLPTGELMTETQAILVWLADSHPKARLAPPVDDVARPAFLRWMAFVSSAIYALYWITDDPSRVTDRPAEHALVKARLFERISHCWGLMGSQLSPDRYLLGDDLSVLDLFVATASRWSPGRARFYEVCPNLRDAIRRVDDDLRLRALWAERFPFTDGWGR